MEREEVREQTPDIFLEITTNSSHDCLYAAMANQNINVYDLSTFSVVTSIEAHRDRINCLRSFECSPSLLCTCSSDRHVRLWDSRSKRKVSELKFSEEILAFTTGMSDTLLAVAVNSSVEFYDFRKPSTQIRSKLGSYVDVHTDIITQMKFDPNDVRRLATAADDGLICFHNISRLDDDEVLENVLSCGCPIRSFGFFGKKNEGIFALTTVETVSFWHHSSAQRLVQFDDIRETMGIDYLVNCFYEAHQDKLFLIGGKYDGEGLVNSIEPDRMVQCGDLIGGHSGIIRSGITLDESKPLEKFVTGGEDGKLCMWTKSQ